VSPETATRRAPTARRAGGAALVVFAALVISLSMVLSRLAYDAGSNALTVLCLRYGCAVPVLVLLLRRRGLALGRPRRDLIVLWVLGALFWAQTGGYLASVAWIPISLAVLIFYTYPLLTALLASVVDRAAPGAVQGTAFVVAFGGLVLALEVSFESLHPLGIGLAAGGALAGAIVFVCTSRALARIDTLLTTLHMSIAGLVISTSVAVAAGAFRVPATALGWGALAGAVACFVVFLVAMFSGLRLIGPVRTTMILNLEPPATIVLAMALLGEQLAAQQGIGAALVLGAIVAAQLWGGEPAPTAGVADLPAPPARDGPAGRT